MFERCEANLLLFDHDHDATDVCNGTRYINPGAAGCNCKGLARYCVIDVASDEVQVSHRQVPYDYAAVIRALEDRRVPARGINRKAFFDCKD